MKKKILSLPILLQYLINYLQRDNLNPRKILYNKLQLSLLLSFFYSSIIAQTSPPPHIFPSNGTFVVPAGITGVDVQAWGGGGAGGGASGSALVEGRSAGGGGGGAYAFRNITVAANNSLSIVVAGQSTGTATNGTAGGHSTITGFESLIYAAGGAGGIANTSGGNVSGGAGGLAGSSFGTTTTSGANGDGGFTVLAAILLSSGKGGNAASPGGGTGGASVSSLVLASAVGNNGNSPGGGGSGGMSSALATARNGGAGASGQITLTYTCPTYSISTIVASSTCHATGNSLIQLTSTAAGLPIGTYTVYYTRSNPAGSATATMTVTTAGSGSFTAMGFTSPGVRTITIDALTSGSTTISGVTTNACSNTISSNNVANVNVFNKSTGGTVGGGTTICFGATSATLALTGNTGSITGWEFSVSPFSTWTPIANTTTSYTSGPLTQTTQFRAVIKNGDCDAENSASTTVTVNPLPQGTLTANGPFCATGSGLLTFTATAGTGPYTIIYKENGGADRTATGVVSGTSFAPFTATVTGSTTYTLVSVTGSNTCSRTSSFTGGSAAITVNPLPQGSLTVNGPFCATGSGLLTFTATAGTGPYTIVYKENGGADRTASGVVSGTSFTPFTPTVTGSTTYTLVSVTGSLGCARTTTFTGGTATITVNPLPQGSLTANGPFCATGSGQLTFTASAGTGPYTIVYKENGGADRTASGVVSGTSFAPFTSTVTGSTTYTLVSVTGSDTCSRTTGFTGGSATIIVNPLPQGSLTANGPFCTTGSGLLTFTATAGTGPYTIVYKENGGADRTASGVVSGTSFAPFTSTVTGSTTYTLVSVTGSDTCSRTTGFTAGSAAITVNSLPQGSLTANGPFCATGSGLLTFTATAGTGPYTIVYKENGGADRTASGVVSGTSFAPFTSTVTGSTTYTLVSVTGSGCVRTTSFTGGSATITVNPLPQGSLTANGPFCATGSGQLTFTATVGTGPYTIVYKENGGADRTASGVVSGTSFAPFTATVTGSTTYTLVSVTGSDTCSRTTGFTAGSATITVNPLPQGSLTANGPFCATGSGLLTFTATAGTGPYTIVYKENSGANQTATGVVSGTSFTPFTATVTGSTTYTLVSVTGSDTCSRTTGFTGGSAVITVNPLPQGSLTANGPFCATGSGQLTFTATAGTGPYTIVYKENGGANQTATGVVSGTSFTPFTAAVTGSTTYTLVSVTGSDTCSRTTGFTGGSAVITVNPLPQGSLTANGPFCATGSGLLTFTATAGTGPYTIVYKENGGANQTATGVISGTSFTPFTAAVTGSTTYTLVSVTGSDTCSRTTGFTGGTAVITVNPLPQGSLTANGPFCATGSGQLTFTSTAGTGPYTIVYKENGGADRTATGIVSGTSFAPFTSTVTGSTTYTLVSVTGSDSCSRTTGFTGGSAVITVNPLPQGSLTANGPFCATGSGLLTFTSTAGTGPYTIVYKENGGADRTASGVVSGTSFTPFTATVTGSTTYTLVSVTGLDSCSRTTGFTGGSAVITVNPLPQGSLTANGPFCATGSGQLTFTSTAGTGPYTIVYKENGGADRTATGIVSGTSFAPFTATVTGSTTYTLVSVTGSDTCSRTTGFTGGSAVITVNPLPQGSLTANGPFCATGSGQLTFTSTAGTGPYTIVYKENGGADRTASGVVSATSFAPFTATVTSSTTYTLVSVTGSDSCSRTTGFTGGSATITVNSTPSIPIQGTITQPNCVTPTGSISLSGLVASGTWTITQGGTSTNSYSSSGTSYLISNLAPGTYTFSIGNALGCTSSATASIVINSPVTNTWNGSVWSTGSPPVATEAALFTGNYQTTGNLSACSCTVNAGATVIVNSGHTLTIANFVNNNGGTLTFENNSSLLQTSDAVNTGNIIYKRITPGIRRFDLTYWSSPVVRTPAFTLKDLSPNTLRDKYYYWNTTTGWTVILDGTQEMGKGIGYSIRAPQPYDTTIPATYTAVFTGVPNNGPVSVSVGPADKWNLIGNPYPSAIYADQFIVDNQANIYGTLYFWTHNSLPSAAPGSNLATYNNDDFAIYNLTGNATVGGLVGTGASTPGNQNPPLGYIAAGQAFFAKSKTGLNAVFTNSMRVVGSNTQFYKTSNADKADVTIEKHRVWLNLTNTQGAFKQILIGYVTGATNLWDNNYDGLTIDANKYVDFYSINEDRKLVIQGRALPFSDLDTVPLGYRSELAGVFSIAIDHADGDLSTHSIYLEDKVTGLMQDLQISNYTFTTAIGTFTDRFVLRYKNSAVLGTDDLENEKNRVIVSVKNKIIKLSSNSNTENLNEVVIFDVSGKVLYDKKQIGSNQLEISNLKSGEQVLIVKTILDNGYTTTNKIIF